MVDVPDVGQRRPGPPENLISFEEVFGDPMTVRLPPKEPAHSQFWEYVRSLGLKPEHYEATQSDQWHGWLLTRRGDG